MIQGDLFNGRYNLGELSMKDEWVNRAALFELLALAFLFTKKELAVALVSNEYAEALLEISGANNIAKEDLSTIALDLAVYHGADAEAVFHELRQEHTRLFIGSPESVVSPFAGVWYAEEIGVEPLLFVNKKSMAVERFMRSCGVGQPEGTNDPLDHIGTELEFLQYLCMLRAEAVQPSESIEMPESAYEGFYVTHFSGFSKKFAAKTIKESRIPFFRTAAQVLRALPEEPL
jgi:TorA maturation chaperone TorD